MSNGNQTDLDTLKKIITGKGSKDQPYQYAELPLNGRLRTSVDGSELGKGDFQVLKNMRYGEVTPKSVGGMTKITSSVIDATYLKPRAGHHFRKTQPSESHVLVQSWNAGMTASQVHENTTAIPNVGDFTATNIWSDATGSSTGRFSDAPDGCVAYCNGKETLIWGGVEYRVASFLVGDPDGTTLYNYTSRINNILDDTDNIAVMKSLGGSIDSYVKLLLHMDGSDDGTTFTDSSGGGHTFTAAGNAHTHVATRKYGTASCYLDGTGDYIWILDHADFDLSGGIWTIDFWINADTGGASGTYGIYFDDTGADDYMSISWKKAASGTKPNTINLSIKATTVLVNLSSAGFSNTKWDSTWHHIEVSQKTTEYYIFIDGVLSGQATSVTSPANYTGKVYIGCEGPAATPANYFKGYIDEVCLSNGICRHTTNFSPTSAPYVNGVCDCYIGSTRPIKGVKFYIKTANTAVSSCRGYYWAEGQWTEVSSLVDGTLDTATSTKTLNKTGSITFTSTVSTAKTRMINDIYSYWYRFSFDSIGATTSVYYVTLDAPIQPIVDIWDGIMRPISSYLRYSTKYHDETTNVLKEDYYHITGDPADNLTYSNMSITTAQYVLCGFTERLCGIDFKIVTDKANSVATLVSVYHWNGSEWTLCSGINDGTKEGAISFAKSGTISWDAPEQSSEFQTSVRSSSRMYWFYKIMVSVSLSANVFIDQVQGVPAQKKVNGYSYPVLWQNRLWLLGNNYGKRNSAICSATDTVCVFNGEDSISPDGPLEFGTEDELVAGATIFSRFSGMLSDNLILFKRTEVWLLDGTKPEDYRKYKISDKYGCVAPGSLKVCDMGYKTDEGPNRHVLIWQSQSGIVMFDGSSIFPISNDIEDKFDPMSSTCISYSLSSVFNSFYDSAKYEYHWMFASDIVNTEKITNGTLEAWTGNTPDSWTKYEAGTSAVTKETTPANVYSGAASAKFSVDSSSSLCGIGQNFILTNNEADVTFSMRYKTSDAAKGLHLFIAEDITTATLKSTGLWDEAGAGTPIVLPGSTTWVLYSITFKRFTGYSNYSVAIREDASVSYTFYTDAISILEPTGTGQEWVYDLRYKKWFQIDRGSTKYLQIGFEVRSTTGNVYTYGGIDTGYIERLENGTDFDGNDITSNFRTGDIPLGGWMVRSQIVKIKHMAVSKTTMPDLITMTHRGDGISTATDTTLSINTNGSGKRICIENKSAPKWGNSVFHSIDCSVTTDDEDIGYEPLGLGVMFKLYGDDVNVTGL